MNEFSDRDLLMMAEAGNRRAQEMLEQRRKKAEKQLVEADEDKKEALSTVVEDRGGWSRRVQPKPPANAG